MKITELMDNYTDNEILIEGVQEADAEKVLQGVTARIRVKKHLRLRSKIIIAAATAIIGLFAITAATSTTAFVSRLGQTEVLKDSCHESTGYGEILPYEIVDGRVIFTAVDEGEEKIDITDLISDEKAFYYEYSKEDSNGKAHNCVIAVGGTPDDLGYGEIFFDLWGGNSTYAVNVNFTYYLIDGKEVLAKDLTEEQYIIRTNLPRRHETKPWVREFHAKAGHDMPEEDTSYLYPPGSN